MNSLLRRNSCCKRRKFSRSLSLKLSILTSSRINSSCFSFRSSSSSSSSAPHSPSSTSLRSANNSPSPNLSISLDMNPLLRRNSYCKIRKLGKLRILQLAIHLMLKTATSLLFVTVFGKEGTSVSSSAAAVSSSPLRLSITLSLSSSLSL